MILTVMKDKSGSSTPLILCIVLACLLLSTAVFEYVRLMIVAQGVRDAVQEAVIDVATENWDEAYVGPARGIFGRISAIRQHMVWECHDREH